MFSELVLLVAVLASFLAPISGGNINIDSTCSVGSGCLQCMSRRSGDVERCQQLYFYITYSTGAPLTRSNQNEIDRYCNGDCPLILATANFFCTNGLSSSIGDLLQLCPSYSVNPTGSFNVPRLVDASSCLPLSFSSSRCLQCIAEDNTEAVRCMQLHFLANHQNVSSTYASQYCEGNCPLVLNSFSSYCGGSFFANSYSYCRQRSNGQYCGQLQAQSPSDFDTAVSNCFADCTSRNCGDSINEYGCCLRQRLVGVCTNIPTCNFQVDASTTAIQIDSDCSITGCGSCLTRDNDDLQRCEQIYAYLVAAQDLVASQASSTMEDFCFGNCPILLLTSDYYCGRSTARPFLWQFCPSYQRIPSVSVEVQASYGNDLSCPVSQDCEECIGSRSPEVTRCLQLYLLSRQHPNMTDYYVTQYCRGNCPLTLSTSQWYCDNSGGFSLVEDLFSVCRRTTENQFCSTLILQNQSDFDSAQSNCQASCTSLVCISARNRYGCCLSGPTVPCDISECAVLTAHAPPPNLTPPLLLAFSSVLMYHISRI